MKFSKDYIEIRGDASYRKFYRNKKKKTILVYAKQEKKQNLLIYDAINKILIKNKILSPKLLKQNYKDNFIEIQDLGKETIYEILKKKKINNYLIFKKIINTLNSIQKIKDHKVKNFKGNIYKIKKYDNNILFKEAKLFSKWYMSSKLSKNQCNRFNLEFNYHIKFLLSKLHFKNQTFVHRDFHVSNLMYFQNSIGLIDSQDALIGNRAYDLASLVDDVRLKTSNQFKNKIFNYYLNVNRGIKIDKFKNDFEILSVLRNLKIIGIFTRLAKRDNKKRYLKLIPYAWQMIILRMKYNNEFKNFNYFMKENLPKIFK